MNFKFYLEAHNYNNHYFSVILKLTKSFFVAWETCDPDVNNDLRSWDLRLENRSFNAQFNAQNNLQKKSSRSGLEENKLQ